ncbi:unnamed protein product [Caenorhabditis angaria]|uniref:Uncharacterized protein n=1 Tax=Caenorhabditis angaria TaxID=860376 RepID=A0A9P1IF27_9PELO|nr:unnamed protein product [Caenorhabditis angaria]
MALLGVDTTSLLTQHPLEMLLISASSPDPHSTIIIDPKTGVSAWTYKGAELQGAAPGALEILGEDAEHMILATKDARLVHLIGVPNKDRFHQKIVMPAAVSAICSLKSGKIVFMAIGKQIFAWLLSSGELLSVVDAHYQNISRLVVSDDDSMIFSAAKDGAVHGYLVNELISSDRDHTITPFCKFSTHTLAITDLKITANSSNPRILTSGRDHICAYHSISLNSTLLKISADRPISACAIDLAETRLFLGTDLGNIAQINLFQLSNSSNERELIVSTSDEQNCKFRILNGHSDEITRICVNSDGNLMASGDSTGKYCIWEVASHQCLKVSNMRAAIQTLKFIPFFDSISANSDLVPKIRPIWDLKKEPTKLEKLAIEVSDDLNSEKDQWKNVIDETLEQLLSGNVNFGQKSCCHAENLAAENPEILEEDVIILEDDEDSEKAPEVNLKSKKRKNKKGKPQTPVKPSQQASNSTSSQNSELQKQIDELKAENSKLKQINAQMYEFVAKEMAED